MVKVLFLIICVLIISAGYLVQKEYFVHAEEKNMPSWVSNH